VQWRLHNLPRQGSETLFIDDCRISICNYAGPTPFLAAVISAYVNRVHEFFRYTYAIPVKHFDEEDRDVPEDQLARYHLIFGTRHARAVIYMNDVALTALEPYFNHFKDGLLFDMTPDRHQPAAYRTARISRTTWYIQ
jgi:hypothetical protein